MNLRIAKSAGFCFGVKRAMELAEEAAKKNPRNLYMLGPLIHNPQAVGSLEKLGVKVRDRVEDIPGGTVIFRSHGISLQDFKKAKKKGLRIIDATCPIVKKAQFFAKFLHRHRYFLLIVGDAKHPEVEAIRSYVGRDVEVVDRVARLKGLGPWERLGVIAQTTQSLGLLKEIVSACLERSKELRVFNTICHATTLRQKEAIAIAKKVDCMIVVGGHNSGNTQRLASICREIQPRTYHIEEARELRPEWFAHSAKVGLTAGVSAPRWLIEEAEKEIRRLQGSTRRRG